MERITSIKDDRIKAARELTTSVGRSRANKCLLEGAQAITWALQAGIPVQEVFWEQKYSNDELLEKLSKQKIPCYHVSEGIAKKITNTSYLVPVIGVAELPPDTKDIAGMGDFVVVLDQVQDHGNIGAIIRSASAFGIQDVLFSHPTDPYFKKTIDASRGTIFRSNLKRFSGSEDTVAQLKKRYQLIATSPRGTKLQSLAPLKGKPIALILGNETSGVSDELLNAADLVVQMPMSSAVESLNVAVFAGISMYELKLRMILTMLTSFIKKTLGRQVNVAGHLIQSVFHAALQEVTDLSATQVILLMIMTCDEIMSREQIEKDTGSFGDELAGILAPLLKREYISQNTDNTYQITSLGKETLVKLWPLVEATEQKIVADFSEEEKRQLNNYLERIQENCMKILNN